MQPGGSGLNNGIDPFANAGTLESAAPVTPAPGAVSDSSAAIITDSLSTEPQAVPRGPKTLLHFNKLAFGVTTAATAVVVIIGVATLAFSGFKANDQNDAASKQPASGYDIKDLSAAQSSADLVEVTKAAKLSINGELQVGSTFVLTPTATPTTPQAGQIYYNKDTNTPLVYNGSSFVSLTDQPDVDSIGGVTGSLNLGPGLQIAGNQLGISTALQQSIAAKVTTIQGQSGDVSFFAGRGIAVNGTIITNTGVVAIVGENGLVTEQNNGSVKVSLPQLLGKTNTPRFAGLELTSALGAAYGGTGFGTGTLAGNSLLITNTDGTAYELASSTTGGQCLITDAADNNKIKFGSCGGSTANGVNGIRDASNNIVDGDVMIRSAANSPLTVTANTAASSIDLDLRLASGRGLTFVTASGVTGLGLQSCSAADKILKWNGSSWICADDEDTIITDTNTTYTEGDGIEIDATNNNAISILLQGTNGAGSGLSLDGSGLALMDCSVEGNVLKWNSANGWVCGTDSEGTGDGVGITNISGEDAALSVDLSDSSHAILNLVVESGRGLAKTANGLGLQTCATTGNVLKWNGSAWICAPDDDTVITDTNTTYDDGDGIFIDTNNGNAISILLQGSASGLAFNEDGELTLDECSTLGAVLKWNGSGWVCDTDEIGTGDGNTTYTEGDGIEIDATNNNAISILLQGTNGAGSGLSLDGSGLALMDCSVEGNVLKWNSANGWVCGTDSEGTGDGVGITNISGEDAALSVDLSDSSHAILNLVVESGRGLAKTANGLGLQTCGEGRILKVVDGDWECELDADTNTQDGVGVTALGAIDNQAKTSTGGTVVDTDGVKVLYLQSADETHAGLVLSGNQTFGGVKTFASGLTISSGQYLTLGSACSINQVLSTTSSGVVECQNVVDNNTTYADGDGIEIDGGNNISVALQGGTAGDSGLTFVSGNLALRACSEDDILKSDGTGWFCSADNGGDGTGIATLTSTSGSLSVTGSATEKNVEVNVAGTGGLKILSGGVGIGLTDECSDNDILKYDFGTASWVCGVDGGDGAGITSVGNLITTGTKDAKGASINVETGQIFLQEADASYAGLMTTNNQVFTGDKTFRGNLIVGHTGVVQGQLTLATTGAGSVLIRSNAQSSNVTITIPTVGTTAQTLCLQELNNCSGSGISTYQTPTAGKFARFYNDGGVTKLANSNLSEAGSELEYTGNVTVTGSLQTASAVTPALAGVTSTGSDAAGGSVAISAGNGTGMGGSGDIVFSTAKAANPFPLMGTPTPTAYNGNNVNSASFTHTVPNGTDRLLVVMIAQPSTSASASTMTYGGVTMTKLTSVNHMWSTERLELWYLVNPSVGSGTIATSFSGYQNTYMRAVTLTGVDQTTPFGTPCSTGSGNSATASCSVTTTTKDLVIDLMGAPNLYSGMGAGQTSVVANDQLPGASKYASMSYKRGNGASVTSSYTFGSSSQWAMISAPVHSSDITYNATTANTMTERLRVSSNGNVGVNNANPQYQLDIVGDINTSANLRTGGTSRLSSTGLLQNTTFDTQNIGSLKVNNPGAPGALVVDSSGNVSMASTTTEQLCLLSNGATSAPSFQTCPSGSTTAAAFQNNGNTFNANAVLGTQDNFGLSIIQNGTTRINLAQNGNISLSPSANYWVHINATDSDSEAKLIVGGRVRATGYKVGATLGSTLTQCSSYFKNMVVTGGLVTAGECSTGSSGQPLLQGGNNFNATMTVGTTDNNGINIIQNNTTRLAFSQPGDIDFTVATNRFFRINSSVTDGEALLTVNGGIRTETFFKVGTQRGMSLSCGGNNSAVGSAVYVGGILVGGSCQPNNSDLAEAYNSSDSLVPGELVMSTTEAATSVKRATSANNDGLMGIVSTEPGHLIGTAQVPNGYPIALSGRVPTKVNTEGGAINVGDKITISSVPGVGKKATSAGMIVGTAVEAFNGTGTGVIEVFVNLTYYEPTDLDMLQAQTAQFGDLNVSGTATVNNLTVTGLASVQDLKISGHIITASGQPTTATQAAAGTGATVTVNGNDTTGTITLTTGDSAATGEMIRVIFSDLYGEAPHVVLSPSNAAAARVSFFKGTTSTESFMLNFDEAPAAHTTYVFDYFISQ